MPALLPPKPPQDKDKKPIIGTPAATPEEAAKKDKAAKATPATTPEAPSVGLQAGDTSATPGMAAEGGEPTPGEPEEGAGKQTLTKKVKKPGESENYPIKELSWFAMFYKALFISGVASETLIKHVPTALGKTAVGTGQFVGGVGKGLFGLVQVVVGAVKRPFTGNWDMAKDGLDTMRVGINTAGSGIVDLADAAGVKKVISEGASLPSYAAGKLKEGVQSLKEGIANIRGTKYQKSDETTPSAPKTKTPTSTDTSSSVTPAKATDTGTSPVAAGMDKVETTSAKAKESGPDPKTSPAGVPITPDAASKAADAAKKPMVLPSPATPTPPVATPPIPPKEGGFKKN